MRILKQCNFELNTKIKENIIINGKWTKYTRILFLSDIYFLLFEQEKKSKLRLVFWGSINTILMVKKILVNNMVFMNWKQKGTNEPFEMSLSMDKSEEIVKKIIDRMNYFGINYSVTKEIKGLPSKNISETDQSNISNSSINYIDKAGSFSERSESVVIGDDFSYGGSHFSVSPFQFHTHYIIHCQYVKHKFQII